MRKLIYLTILTIAGLSTLACGLENSENPNAQAYSNTTSTVNHVVSPNTTPGVSSASVPLPTRRTSSSTSTPAMRSSMSSPMRSSAPAVRMSTPAPSYRPSFSPSVRSR